MYYYTVTYSFDFDHRLVGPFVDEKSCWEEMKRDALHEHEEDICNGSESIVEENIDGGIIQVKIPRELDDVPDITTWALFDKMESPKNTAKAEMLSHYDSGACFHVPCMANLKTREVSNFEVEEEPCADDSASYEEVVIDGVCYPLRDLDMLVEYNVQTEKQEREHMLKYQEFWYSLLGNTPDKPIKREIHAKG